MSDDWLVFYICLTIVVLAWIGRGAHDMRMRIAAQRYEEQEWDKLNARMGKLEKRVDDAEKVATDAMTTHAMGRRR